MREELSKELRGKLSKEGSWEVVLFSDGGGQKSSTAAGACVVQDGDNRTGLAVFLGEATNNESEISGGLIGFNFLKLSHPSAKVTWVCDSEYVLKSATGYINNWQRNNWKTASKQDVKNKGLWHCYLELSKGFNVVAQHVKGHSGHPENETCDTISTWVRLNGEEALDGKRVSSFELETEIGVNDWILLDGREFLSILRDGFSKPSVEKAIEQVMIGDTSKFELKRLASLLEQSVALADKLSLEEVSRQVKTLIGEINNR